MVISNKEAGLIMRQHREADKQATVELAKRKRELKEYVAKIGSEQIINTMKKHHPELFNQEQNQEQNREL